MRITKQQLAFGVASAALAAGISSQAQAACTTSDAAVACSDANTVTAVNAAMAGVSGDDLSLSIGANATVEQPGTVVSPTHIGSVAITNNGALGTDLAPVGVSYVGDITSADNAFALTNRGSITGQVSVSGVGGSINVANSGVIGNDSGLQAIYAASGASAYSSSSDTSSDAGVTTTTNNSASSIAGGTVDVAVNAGGSNGAVTAAGVDGASVTIDGAVGSVDQASSVSASSQFGTSADSNTMVSSADTYHYEDHSSTATVGGDASVAIGASGSVSGNVASNGFTSASVTVDGTVGADGDNRTVSANSAGVATTYDSIVDVDYTNGDTSSSNTSGYERTGGDASVAVGANGVIHGSVNAQGDGSATVSNGGLITGPVVANSAIYTQTGSHSASSNSSTSASSGSVSSSESSYGYEYQTLGGTASVVNAAGATIEGNTSATGI